MIKKPFKQSPKNILETFKKPTKYSEEFLFYTSSDNFQYFHCCSGRDRGFGIFSIISHYHDCPGTHSHRHKTATSIPAKFSPNFRYASILSFFKFRPNFPLFSIFSIAAVFPKIKNFRCLNFVYFLILVHVPQSWVFFNF